MCVSCVIGSSLGTENGQVDFSEGSWEKAVRVGHLDYMKKHQVCEELNADLLLHKGMAPVVLQPMLVSWTLPNWRTIFAQLLQRKIHLPSSFSFSGYFI